MTPAPRLPLAEPAIKRAIAFIDGQNLYHSARELFGHRLPNYDVRKLAERTCEDRGWSLAEVRFYTGVPLPERNLRLNQFWARTLLAFTRQGVVVYSRPLIYRQVPQVVKERG